MWSVWILACALLVDSVQSTANCTHAQRASHMVERRLNIAVTGNLPFARACSADARASAKHARAKGRLSASQLQGVEPADAGKGNLVLVSTYTSPVYPKDRSELTVSVWGRFAGGGAGQRKAGRGCDHAETSGRRQGRASGRAEGGGRADIRGLRQGVRAQRGLLQGMSKTGLKWPPADQPVDVGCQGMRVQTLVR